VKGEPGVRGMGGVADGFRFGTQGCAPLKAAEEAKKLLRFSLVQIIDLILCSN